MKCVETGDIVWFKDLFFEVLEIRSDVVDDRLRKRQA